MMIEEHLPGYLDEAEIVTIEAPGNLYKVENHRRVFGEEILLIRYLENEHSTRELLESDITELESRFYDNQTPNQWNIRLIWAYEDGNRPPQDVRDELENDTRFAIRRCVPIQELAGFIAPLQSSLEKLGDITSQYDRSNLIDSIIDQGLGFLFDDISREDKLNRLKSGATPENESSVSPPTVKSNPLNKFVDITHLGNFRQKAHLDELDADTFTLLYGRNGTGKTSLLDGTALGLIGQIRHEEGRAADYDGLNVVLEGESEPLPTDSASVNERVANWFGFRPHGRAKKYIEFNRVNYHQAGAATRFIENDPDLNIGQTLRRLIIGEELEDARKDKEKLLPRLEKQIKENEDEIEDLEIRAQEIREQREKVKEVFSRLEIASENLSPAANFVLFEDSDVTERDYEPTPEPSRLKKFATWKPRFDDLRSGLDTLSESVQDIDNSGELRHALLKELDQTEEIINDIGRVKDLQSAQSRLNELRNSCSKVDMNEISASVGFIGLVLGTNGLDLDRLSEMREVTKQEDDLELEPTGINSIEGWRESATEDVTQRLENLLEQKRNIEELDELDERRRQLQSEIRSQTEEYISITEEVYHCPACYIEQDGKEILTREKPDRLHGGETDSVPDSLMNRITKLEEAKEVLTTSEWKDIDYDVSVRFDDIVNVGDFQQLWIYLGEPTDFSPVFSGGTTEILQTFAKTLRTHVRSDPDDISLVQAIEFGIEEIEAMLSELLADIPDFDKEQQDVLTFEEHHRGRIDDIQAALHVFDEYWPEQALHERLDVRNDYRTIHRTLEEVEQKPEALDVPGDYQEDLDEIEDKIDELQEEIRHCQDSIERLETAFDGNDEETDIEDLIADHMSVTSTLFKTFQSPYEFNEVRYEDNEVVVERLDEEVKAAKYEMSSGQRAALALAIFVTNNIAHEKAPPLMMLDEPFAHLDDINSLSFFNVLIELARTGRRQIIFATASEEIAKLLERKVGETDQFTRIDIPATDT